MKISIITGIVTAVFFFVAPLPSNAYGVLTHEGIIDAAWEKSIVPLLKQKYPSISAEQLKEAHAYAYGGAVSPDMGYYPSGSKLFTDLVHYVRSGDMVEALLKNSENVNQYAFALGFLSHYNADKYGHPLGTNRCVPLIYPELNEKYGNKVTYAEDNLSHIRTEFGFDVLQVAKGNYASQSYREFIGFKVDTAILSKAFSEVYGLDINKVFKNHFNRSTETFRFVVANIFPLITRSAWAAKKDEIRKQDSTATGKRFKYKMRQRNYRKTFGTGYKRPGLFPTFFSFIIRALPKIGPLRALKFRAPGPKAEKYFIESFDSVLHHYSLHLTKLQTQPLSLSDLDFDTGKPTERCEYLLADIAYSDLVLKHKSEGFRNLSFALQQNITTFYQSMNIPDIKQGKLKYCNSFGAAFSELKAVKVK
ncbi:MAG: zinc dependent phospholipase C family protein [Ferruginibacter sp.]